MWLIVSLVMGVRARVMGERGSGSQILLERAAEKEVVWSAPSVLACAAVARFWGLLPMRVRSPEGPPCRALASPVPPEDTGPSFVLQHLHYLLLVIYLILPGLPLLGLIFLTLGIQVFPKVLQFLRVGFWRHRSVHCSLTHVGAKTGNRPPSPQVPPMLFSSPLGAVPLLPAGSAWFWNSAPL